MYSSLYAQPCYNYNLYYTLYYNIYYTVLSLILYYIYYTIHIGYEGVSGVKLVRETLTELGLAHTLINCANGSKNREKLTKSKGN